MNTRARRTVAVLAVLVALLPVGLSAGPAVGSAGVTAAEAAAARPDIIVVMTDDQRVGTERAMSNVSAFFGNGGIRYTGAQVPTNLCCPARAAFLTGKYAHTTGVWENSGPNGGYKAFAPQEGRTLAVALSAAGYRTALFGKYINHFNTVTEPDYVPPGWDAFHVPASEDQDGGYDTPIRGLPFGYTTDTLGRGTADYIRTADPDQPLFVMYSPFAPHYPYDPGPYAGRLSQWDLHRYQLYGKFRNPAFNEKNVSDKPEWVRRTKRMRPRAWQDLPRKQAETLLGVDANFASIIASQARYRDLSNTMVVFLSDNGYAWGEHRLLLKRHPYDLANRIPLWIKYPAGTPVTPGVDTGLVNNLDVTATILDMAGAQLGTEGISLLSGTRRSRLLLEAAPSLAGLQKSPGFCGLRTRRHLFVQYTSGETELYDYRKDPYELRNVAGKRRYRDLVRRKEARLLSTGCSLTALRLMRGADLDRSGD